MSECHTCFVFWSHGCVNPLHAATVRLGTPRNRECFFESSPSGTVSCRGPAALRPSPEERAAFWNRTPAGGAWPRDAGPAHSTCEELRLWNFNQLHLDFIPQEDSKISKLASAHTSPPAGGLQYGNNPISSVFTLACVDGFN